MVNEIKNTVSSETTKPLNISPTPNYQPWADNARIIAIFAVVLGHSITISLLKNTSNNAAVLFWGSLYHAFTRWSILCSL